MTAVRTDRNLTLKRFAELGLPKSDFYRIIVWELDPDNRRIILDICEPLSSVGAGPMPTIKFFNKCIRRWNLFAPCEISIEVRQPCKEEQ